jgi:hypothetical protein
MARRVIMRDILPKLTDLVAVMKTGAMQLIVAYTTVSVTPTV